MRVPNCWYERFYVKIVLVYYAIVIQGENVKHNPKEQLEILSRGVEEIIPLDELESKLKRSKNEEKPLRVKLGLDPSAPDIHIGHAVVLRKLRQFQDLGHKAVLIVGDFTGTIGDPSGRTDKRKQLSEEEVRENAKTYVDQLMMILDRKRTEVVYNADWLKKLSMAETLQLTSTYTVARMLERDDFSLRYKDNKPISILEFMYPLLQGYDSVAVKADVELGGTDQKFNLLVGREIQRSYGQESQVIVTTPLLEGTDGVQKMSKSLGNYIGITDPPEEMFGKVMSIVDDLIVRYFRLATDMHLGEIERIEKGLKDESLHPGETKRMLAREIVKIYHGTTEAKEAEHAFNVKHKPGYAEPGLKTEVADSIDVSDMMNAESKIGIIDLIRAAGYAASNSEARRLVRQGAVRLNGNKISDEDSKVPLKHDDLLEVGKRRLGKISLRKS